jgi:hypothetical protein
MESVELLDGVNELIERWGWVQHADETEDGLDLVAAFEVASGVPIRTTSYEHDLLAGFFADEALDRALAMTAEVIGTDPADGPVPDERRAWVHVITCFNDAPATTAGDVMRVLRLTSELASTRAVFRSYA